MIDLQRRRLLGCTLAAALLPTAGSALAADKWPSRPIKWVLPYLAGTGPDLTARMLAEAVSPLLGQPVIIDNKGGVGGNLGARLAAKAAPDGYTWVYSAAPMAANMRMYKEPGYDALKDFHHIMRLTTSDIVLIVQPNSGISSLEELGARMRAQPGKLNYASGGVGTPSHLGVELLSSAMKVDATHVPYKGASELVNAVLGSQVDFGMPIFTVAYPQIKSGKLKALAVAGPIRNPLLPDVPTLAELGVRGVELTSWGGVSVPAATPSTVVARIQSAFEQALSQPALRSMLEANGGNVRPSASSQDYVRGFVKEIELTEAMMKKAQLSPL
ncbi:tripartite tricarboxylate transporter substrate binding protein [Polaromonas sp. SM01]|uniref:Bug family tripartite tricarboxylate transporter substrate binding protein n=1 Tax=Polaromonas sp. SM01 TaxID=3085630 RepID=UPI002980D986|nr:tripartite tricarboxylate transporter substrate binding protein [Polaromonas sp. SM01]MDW5441469.1 tripartite tricarboxylate transporter substrate binding protein [Polaromonas sp. SM01]